MTKGRLEAFSDGVIAILITIMVLNLGVPRGTDLGSLSQVAPNLVAYVLSFLFLGIYWSNHHHLLQAANRVDGRVLWANLHLLFWLSLVPFGGAWIGQTDLAPVPVAIYGVVLLMCAFAYFLLVRALIRIHGRDSIIATAIGRDVKGIVSPLLYLVAVPLALVAPVAAFAIYVLVALIWFVPDVRIERQLGEGSRERETSGGAEPAE
ncbi:MAG TPA: TMEM175 family protein [Candidatus Dormibacteraeota bacterium]|nr:TMEM175 family protein [Candidatus Dormibacteraeota bacterium]